MGRRGPALVALLALTACSPPTPPERQAAETGPPVQPPPTIARTPAQELGLIGAWRGTATQSDGSSYRMLLRVNPTGGAVRYPSFRCGGRLVPIGREGPSIVYRETLTYGASTNGQTGCADGGRVVLSLVDGALSWVWSDAPGFPNLVARSTLQREETTPPY
jgi:hypothetical protein